MPRGAGAIAIGAWSLGRGMERGCDGAARHTKRRALRAWSLLELRCYLQYNMRLKLSVRVPCLGSSSAAEGCARGPQLKRSR